MTAGESSQPVIGFVLVGGPLSGALVRDVRLANELAQRGFRVHAWWVMDRPRQSPLHSSITEHWLFQGARYMEWKLLGRSGRGFKESLGRLSSRIFADKKRVHALQKRPHIMRSFMEGLVRQLCEGVEHDAPVVKRFARQLSEAGVTHLLPMLEFLCVWAAAARPLMSHPMRYLFTFQGYELYGNYARAIGLERALYNRFTQAVEQSDWPAVAVSEDYVLRVMEDIGIDRSQLRAIPPGVPVKVNTNREGIETQLKKKFPAYDPALPLVTFFGRRDTEKGIDLLLYAANILRKQGERFQLAVCGPTLFGMHYSEVVRQIAEDLRCPVLWSGRVSDELRSALFLASRCVVYPSIHREPFGMVPVEALAHGTPAIVPDYGGVASAIEAQGRVAGLRFKVWDSGDLARQIARLLNDQSLWQQLSDAGPFVAEYYSIPRLADRILAHIGLKSGHNGGTLTDG